MQKRIFFFLAIVFMSSLKWLDTEAQSLLTQRADSLFYAKDYEQSAILYQTLLENHDINRTTAYLKMAYISENKGDFSRAIYYLSEYLILKPSNQAFDKVLQLAKDNSFSGYDRSDFNFVTLLVRQYSIWILLAIMVGFVYGFAVILYKRAKGMPIPLSQKYALLLTVIFALTLINLPSLFRSGIVNKHSAFLRKSPSAGGEIIGQLHEGSKVNILGESDIWCRLYKNKSFFYVKKSDLWIIDEK